MGVRCQKGLPNYMGKSCGGKKCLLCHRQQDTQVALGRDRWTPITEEEGDAVTKRNALPDFLLAPRGR